jgi:hypothetical protein
MLALVIVVKEIGWFAHCQCLRIVEGFGVLFIKSILACMFEGI